MHKAGEILGGRIARNVYFWALLIYTRAEFSYTLTQAAFTGILFGLLGVLFYVNNLVLVPKYLAKKKISRLSIMVYPAHPSSFGWVYFGAEAGAALLPSIPPRHDKPAGDGRRDRHIDAGRFPP